MDMMKLGPDWTFCLMLSMSLSFSSPLHSSFRVSSSGVKTTSPARISNPLRFPRSCWSDIVWVVDAGCEVFCQTTKGVRVLVYY
ncbi:hypothetical protein B0H66DRAFT_323829 [Apodospora peruviana]|uniref:Uncharacterized protein n=1 Tax=Apodospora peruviana TaxID=516989 RepID=A0AAE0M0Y7_9PEZI|nr:hypothetical protein B0H66DRAFT_323829 [Apodospora peruviana]